MSDEIAAVPRSSRLERAARDVRKTSGMLVMQMDNGATVIVIEHDLDVIRNADYVIDMGPGGGDAGGTVVFEGVPEDAPAEPRSVTGRHLGRRA